MREGNGTMNENVGDEQTFRCDTCKKVFAEDPYLGGEHNDGTVCCVDCLENEIEAGWKEERR